MRKKIAIAAFAAVLTPIAASALELGVQAIYWMPKINADLEIDGGTNFSVTDTFGVDDQGIPGGRVFFGIGDHHISVSGHKATYEGTKTIDEEISWGDTVVVNAGDRAELTYDYTMIDAAYQYDLIDLENVAAGFSLGPILGVKYLDASAEIANKDNPSLSETKDFTAPIPMVGLGLHVGILMDILEGRAQVTGIGFGGNTVLDGLAEVSFTPFPFLDISAGYRMVGINIDYSDVKVDLTQKGPYAGLTISF